MQPVRRESNLSVEPAVRAAGANKTMAQKNNQALHNWMKVKTSLEKEQVKVARGLEEDRSKLLKQRERLQNASLSLTTSPQQTDGEPADSAARSNGYVPSSKRLNSLAEVYGQLLKTMKKAGEEDSMSTKSEPVGQSLMSRGTRSFQIKRVGRKPISFSLGQLQRLNSNSNLKRLDPTHEEDPEEDESSKTAEALGPFDLNKEELSLGPKLKLPPMCLPPIRKNVTFSPKARDFKKEKLASASSLESAMEDVRYCRYLRMSSGCRRNSAPTNVPRHRFSARKGQVE